jgi:hypothetical protein
MTIIAHNMPKHRAQIAADLRSCMSCEMTLELGRVSAVMRSVDLIHSTRTGTTT